MVESAISRPVAPADAILGRSPAASRHLGWIAVVGLAVAAGVLLTWSAAFCNSLSSDSVLPAMMSVQRVGTYFWGQDRFGSLLPALASWISDVGASLRFQIFLRDASATLFPLFPILILRPRAPLVWTFSVALFAMLAVDSFPLVRQFWPYNQPYGPSFALLIAAIAVLRIPGRGAAAVSARFLLSFGLMLLATWVNSGLGIVVAPLYGLLFLLRRDRESLVLLAMTVIAYFAVTRLVPADQHWEYEGLTLVWRDFLQLPQVFLRSVNPIAAAIAGGLLAVSLTVLFRSGDASERRLASFAVAIIAAAIVGSLATVQNTWVADNGFNFRYFSVEVQLLVTLAPILLVEILWRRNVLPSGWASAVAPGGALAALAFVAAPIDFACRFIPANLAPETDPAARMAVATGARFIAGDFWLAWPAVYTANEKAGSTDIFGASPRGSGAAPRLARIVAGEPNPVVVCMDLGPDACAFQVALTARHGAVPSGIPLAAERTPSGASVTALRLAWSSDIAIPVDAEKLGSQTGKRQGTAFSASPPAGRGYLVFGPYVLVPAGDLTVNFRLSCAGDVAGSYVDVAVGKTGNILAKAALDTVPGLCDGTPKTVTLRARLAKGLGDVEFRTYYGGSGAISVNTIDAHDINAVFGR